MQFVQRNQTKQPLLIFLRDTFYVSNQDRPTAGILLSLFSLSLCPIQGKEGYCVCETVHISVH